MDLKLNFMSAPPQKWLVDGNPHTTMRGSWRQPSGLLGPPGTNCQKVVPDPIFLWPLEVWVDHLFLFVPQVQSQKVAAQSSRRVRGQGIVDGHNLRHALFLFINGFSLGEPSHSIKWGAKEPQEPPRSRGSCSSTECSWLFLVSAPDKLMFTCALRAEA